ncbi:hypothetical protein [Ensifer aridi]|uniref:hypothetical protein n=1 Tax=Ensifer aridi TaxID=1708715 RepID=UPI000A115040|nr:hypothetical protein [Ensifer aridi]
MTMEITPFARHGLQVENVVAIERFFRSITLEAPELVVDADAVRFKALAAQWELEASGLPMEQWNGVTARYYAATTPWSDPGQLFQGIIVRMRRDEMFWRVTGGQVFRYGARERKLYDRVFLEMTDDRLSLIEAAGKPTGHLSRLIDVEVMSFDGIEQTTKEKRWSVPA